MPAYLVQRDRTKSGGTLVNKCDAAVVFAADAAGAKALAASIYQADGAAWADATVTAVAAAADLTGYRFRLRLLGTAVDVSYTGVASDTWDLVAAALVTALNATAEIANAAYNATTNVLTVAGVADALGDMSLVAELFLPGCEEPVSGVLGAVVSAGAEADAVTLAMPADGAVIPTLISRVRAEA